MSSRNDAARGVDSAPAAVKSATGIAPGGTISMPAELIEPMARVPEAADSALRVLFVCTGNTCRSPMAAAALNFYGAGFYTADSAGLFPYTGAMISRYAVEALGDAGILPSPSNNYTAHSARKICEADFASFDRVIGITEAHSMALIRDFPLFASKITALPRDICDPYGGTREDYRRCLSEIIGCLKELFLL